MTRLTGEGRAIRFPPAAAPFSL